MLPSVSWIAEVSFAVLVAVAWGVCHFIDKRAKAAKGFADAGEAHWFVHGIAFAGDYLTGATLLGVCGLIAYYGYDGFLYAIGLLAGWVAALFLIAEPIRRLGRFTLADALGARFNSGGVRRAAAVSTVVVAIMFLIPEMVAGASLIEPLLGIPVALGLIVVGAIVVVIALTAGVVGSTWVQFMKGGLLVLVCGLLTVAVFARGLRAKETDVSPRIMDNKAFAATIAATGKILEPVAGWARVPYVRVQMPDGSISTWRYEGQSANPPMLLWPSKFTECQTLTVPVSGPILVNGKPQTKENDLHAAGFVQQLPGDKGETGPLGPLSFLSTIQDAEAGLPRSERVADADGAATMIYYPRIIPGSDVMTAGNHPTLFPGIKSHVLWDQLNFVSFMLALFCGAAALPQFLTRYYTAKDRGAARKASVVGVGAMGLFCILMPYVGLGAMTAGTLDPDVAGSNMAVPLLARASGEFAFALVSAVVFTTVLGTAPRLITAAAGVVAGDLMGGFKKMEMGADGRTRAGKIAAVGVGIVAVGLGILCRKFNAAFLLAWAFNVAASANLPAVTMLLFWKGATKKGIVASIIVGLVSSVAWILLSADAYANIYGLNAADAPLKMNQPALFTIPLAFLTLIVVSLVTAKRDEHSAMK